MIQFIEDLSTETTSRKLSEAGLYEIIAAGENLYDTLIKTWGSTKRTIQSHYNYI